MVFPTEEVFASGPFINYQDAPVSMNRLCHGTHCLPLRCVELGVTAVPSRPEQKESLYWMTGLILDALDDTQLKFQRVGMFCVPSSEKIKALGIELRKLPFDVRVTQEQAMKTIRIF